MCCLRLTQQREIEHLSRPGKEAVFALFPMTWARHIGKYISESETAEPLKKKTKPEINSTICDSSLLAAFKKGLKYKTLSAI